MLITVRYIRFVDPAVDMYIGTPIGTVSDFVSYHDLQSVNKCLLYIIIITHYL